MGMERLTTSPLRAACLRLSWEPCEECGCGPNKKLKVLAKRLRQRERFVEQDRRGAVLLNLVKPERYAVGSQLLCKECWLHEVAVDEGRATRRPDQGRSLPDPTAVAATQYEGKWGNENGGRFREADDLEKRGLT